MTLQPRERKLVMLLVPSLLMALVLRYTVLCRSDGDAAA